VGVTNPTNPSGIKREWYVCMYFFCNTHFCSAKELYIFTIVSNKLCLVTSRFLWLKMASYGRERDSKQELNDKINKCDCIKHLF
jgi:hypothetical protein